MLTEADLPESLYKKRLSRQDALLSILCVRYQKPKKTADIKMLGRNAGLTEIQRWNISDILAKSKGLAIRIRDGWAITSRGREHVRSLNILPEKKSRKVIHYASALRSATKRITNEDTAAFIEEAISSFEAELYRAAVVLSWVGAVSLLQDQIVSHHLANFNAEAQKRDASWKPARTKDDLSKMKESDFLDILASPPISLIGMSVKQELKTCLQLRNGCGHPSSLSIGENRVAAHLEVLILNVFAKFS